MPDVDVSDVLLDSAVAGEAFTVIRRATTTNLDGIVVVVTETLTGMVGGISPVGENSLLLEEAFQTQMEAILVITTFRLRGASKDPATSIKYQPDLVLWQNNYFKVVTVGDWTRFGTGFVAAECIEIDYNAAPPAA